MPHTVLDIPLWAQILIAVLLLTSALFTLIASLGLMRFDNFFLRMHPTALVYTLGVWCVCGAALIFFMLVDHRPAPYVWLIVILLAITIPITTVVLARAVLFRIRHAGLPAPATLSYTIVLGDLAPQPETEQQNEETVDGL